MDSEARIVRGIKMRIIPKKTNVSMEFFNGFTSGDVAVGFVGAVIEVAILVSNLPGKYYIMEV